MNIYISLHNELEKACTNKEVIVKDLLKIIAEWADKNKEPIAKLSEEAGQTLDFELIDLTITILIEEIMMMFGSRFADLIEEKQEAFRHVAIYKIETLRNLLKRYAKENSN